MEYNKSIKGKFFNAAKWAVITEMIAKLITPITNMILARILVPDAFGVVATINMIISFADMITDSGFQKYIVQHEFENEEIKLKSINVAFWTNLSMSFMLWLLLCIYSDKIAIFFGNEDLNKVIIFAGAQLPLTSFTSIQMAIFKREFDYKTLFKVRILSILLPFIVTIPLALNGFGYWALIIGTMSGTLVNAINLTVKSEWKPIIYYNFLLLKKMFSFTIWSLIEAITIWLSSWIDVFIIGSILNSYYLGIYKTSLNTVNSIMVILTSVTMPLLFATLSRLQNDEKSFNKFYIKMQKISSYIILPMGVGVFIYSELITRILLGDNWINASGIIAIWGIINSIKIIFGDYCSEYYRAKGKPKISFSIQIIFIIFYMMFCMTFINKGVEILIISCISGRLIIVIIHNICMKLKFNISILNCFINVRIPILASIIMGGFGLFFKSLYIGVIWDFISILLCIIIYFTLIFIFDKSSFKDIYSIIKAKL
ncbi:lipopolysaccharide biosynthesis protein [uncultured Clostridium sp.]|uniref:lipopolysaccharide biosynthesis protein n=1 Tax=uncultured Clostridium sp. TaxID=59620 RepID=UPI0025902CD9|nr:lipopolysaccharide biosynthesis protein [uncultured Clostridium sp.]